VNILVPILLLVDTQQAGTPCPAQANPLAPNMSHRQWQSRCFYPQAKREGMRKKALKFWNACLRHQFALPSLYKGCTSIKATTTPAPLHSLRHHLAFLIALFCPSSIFAIPLIASSMSTRFARTADKTSNDKHTRILKALLQQPGNKYCVDCRKKGTVHIVTPGRAGVHASCVSLGPRSNCLPSALLLMYRSALGKVISFPC